MNIDHAALFYFFSTAAQSFAALLGIAVTVYIFYVSILSNKAQELAGCLSKIKTGNSSAFFIGSRKDAIGDAEKVLKKKELIGSTLKSIEETLMHLKVVDGQLKSLDDVRKYFFWIFAVVVLFILAIPFVNSLVGWPICTILVSFGAVSVVCIATYKSIEIIMMQP